MAKKKFSLVGRIPVASVIDQLVENYRASLEDDGCFVADEAAKQWNLTGKTGSVVCDEENDVLVVSAAQPDDVLDDIKKLLLPVTELEFDGGVITFCESDGEIRYTDNHGNTEGLWNPGDPDYNTYKEQYFPKCEINQEVELVVNIRYSSTEFSNYLAKLDEVVGSEHTHAENVADDGDDVFFSIMSKDAERILAKVNRLSFVFSAWIEWDRNADDDAEESQRRDEKREVG